MSLKKKLSIVLFFGALVGIFMTGIFLWVGIAVVNSIGGGMVGFVVGVVFAIYQLPEILDKDDSKKPKQ